MAIASRHHRRVDRSVCRAQVVSVRTYKIDSLDLSNTKCVPCPVRAPTVGPRGKVYENFTAISEEFNVTN